MQFAKINGVNLHYQVIGAPTGKPTVVFSNSLGTDFRIWRDVIVRLVGEVGVLTYDKRGHGLSEAGDEAYSISLHASDLAGLMDHAGVSNAIVCGLSVGGMIAQKLAADRNDLVRALMLLDTGHKIGTAEIWNDRIQSVTKQGLEAFAPSIIERWLTPDYIRDNPEMAQGYRTMVARQTLKGYVGTCEAIRDCDLTESTSTLPMPVSVVVGSEDKVTPPSLAKELAKLVPDGRYDEINNAAHLPCIDQPAVLATILKAFISDLK